MVISGCAWLSVVLMVIVVIGGYAWLSVVISGYAWLSVVLMVIVVIGGCAWLSVVISGYQWLSVVISGYMHGCQWLSVVVHDPNPFLHDEVSVELVASLLHSISKYTCFFFVPCNASKSGGVSWAWHSGCF